VDGPDRGQRALEVLRRSLEFETHQIEVALGRKALVDRPEDAEKLNLSGYETGDGLVERVDELLAEADEAYGGWAPEIHRVDGRFVAYFTTVDGGDTLCLGTAHADEITGPWIESAGPLMQHPQGVIDATFFEAEGMPYLFYKIDGKYFILSAWYDERMRMPAARADRPEGPYEVNRAISIDEDFGLMQGYRLPDMKGTKPPYDIRPGDPQATGQDQLVAVVGERALRPEALSRVEAALFALLGMGLPALVALNDAGDGGLADVEGISDPALGFAFHFDPLVDEVGVAVGLPGAAWLSGRERRS
jgi:hypothetical protein